MSFDKKSTGGTFSFVASLTMSGRVNVHQGATLFLPPETDLRSTVEGTRIISGVKLTFPFMMFKSIEVYNLFLRQFKLYFLYH